MVLSLGPDPKPRTPLRLVPSAPPLLLGPEYTTGACACGGWSSAFELLDVVALTAAAAARIKRGAVATASSPSPAMARTSPRPLPVVARPLAERRIAAVDAFNDLLGDLTTDGGPPAVNTVSEVELASVAEVPARLAGMMPSFDGLRRDDVAADGVAPSVEERCDAVDAELASTWRSCALAL